MHPTPAADAFCFQIVALAKSDNFVLSYQATRFCVLRNHEAEFYSGSALASCSYCKSINRFLSIGHLKVFVVLTKIIIYRRDGYFFSGALTQE
jgi:hypothetical protein